MTSSSGAPAEASDHTNLNVKFVAEMMRAALRMVLMSPGSHIPPPVLGIPRSDYSFVYPNSTIETHIASIVAYLMEINNLHDRVLFFELVCIKCMDANDDGLLFFEEACDCGYRVLGEEDNVKLFTRITIAIMMAICSPSE